jgi:hypothetical protein
VPYSKFELSQGLAMSKQFSFSGKSNLSSSEQASPEKKDDDPRHINIDLNDLFDYSLDAEGTVPSMTSHSPLILSEDDSVPFQQQLNNFEKLLQSDQQMMNGLLVPTQPSQDNQRQQKNYFHHFNQDQNDYSSYFMTTQVDTPLRTLRSPSDLTRLDCISLTDLTTDLRDPLFPLEAEEEEQQVTSDWSLQACVGMLFGLKVTDFTQKGGFLPPLSTLDSQFEKKLDHWLTSYTTCTSHLISYDLFLELSLDLHGEMLCVVYGMVKDSSSKHCLVGYLEKRKVSKTSVLPLRCLFDPIDPHCPKEGQALQQNTVPLEQIDWILYFTESTSVYSVSSSTVLEQRQRNHQTEMLSLEESGLYTQEEEEEEEGGGEEEVKSAEVSSHPKNTESYLRLAQSTVDNEPPETPIDEQPFVIEKTTPLQKVWVIEEPTEIVPIDEMARSLTNQSEQLCAEEQKPETPTNSHGNLHLSCIVSFVVSVLSVSTEHL